MKIIGGELPPPAVTPLLVPMVVPASWSLHLFSL